MRTPPKARRASRCFSDDLERDWAQVILSVTYPYEMRIFPAMSDGKPVPQLKPSLANTYLPESPEEHIGEAFSVYKMILRWGTNNISMVSELPEDEHDIYGTSPLQEFYWMLYNLDKENKTTPKQRALLQRKEGSYSTLVSMPTNVLLMQGRLLSRGGEAPFKTESLNDKKHLIIMPQRSSIPELYVAMTEPLDPEQPVHAKNTALGPIAEADGFNLLLNIETSVKERKGVKKSTSSTKDNYFAPARGSRSVLTGPEVLKGWVPWNKLLKFHSVDDQFGILYDEFGKELVNPIMQETRFAALCSTSKVMSMADAIHEDEDIAAGADEDADTPADFREVPESIPAAQAPVERRPAAPAGKSEAKSSIISSAEEITQSKEYLEAMAELNKFDTEGEAGLEDLPDDPSGAVEEDEELSDIP